MKKINFYKLLVAFLLLSNFLLLYFYYQSTIPYEGPKKEIIKKLHFDNEQIKLYQAIIKTHRSKMIQNEQKITSLKTNFYKQLLMEKDALKVQKLSNEIASLQQNEELFIYHHLEELHLICKPNQEVYFKDLVKEFTTLFQPQK
jgi:periplasmic protein CpxP/Spy